MQPLDFTQRMKMLSDKQKETLKSLARNTIGQELGLATSTLDLKDPVFHQKSGLFVTLTKAGELRGCIGSLVAHESIAKGVEHHALNASFHDHRFSPVNAEELDKISIEISILTEPVPLHFTDSKHLMEQLRPGKDGVILRTNGHSATFLPQVWEQLPDPEQFLNNLALKAGLAADGWQQKGVKIEIYSVLKF